MPRMFATYCALLVVVFALANHQGYVFSSLFAGAAKANKAANHSRNYHK